jgi:para-nitrobenzyl esterase
VTIFGESGGGGKVSALIAMPAAKGLFHRAIIQSGVRRRLVGPAGATRASQQVLGKLGLTPDRIGELQAIPYRRLIDAVAAIRPRVNFEPVVDGPVIATHPFDPSAPAASADVPLIIGSNSTETTFLADTPLDPIDAQTLLNRVRQFTRISEAEAGELIRAYKAEEPGASNLELYHAVSSDYWRRADAIKTAELKSARPRGAVYMYYFTWETPVRDGKLRSLHTLEIPFIFRNVDLVPSITGLGADRYLLSDKMSRAWAAFARTGDPSAQGLGEWPPYDLARRATMVFGASSGVANDPLPARRVAMARLLDRRESSDRPA